MTERIQWLPGLGEALTHLYGPQSSATLLRQLAPLWETSEAASVGTDTAIAPPLVTALPDHVGDGDTAPLQVLARAMAQLLPEVRHATHVLPPFLADGDGGYAVLDHTRVRPQFGSFDDLRRLGSDGLMLDFVLNHVSTSSAAFTSYLDGDDDGMFIGRDTPQPQASWGFRPRSYALFQPFPAREGTRWVWCTYGRGQADLNYRTPAVFAQSAKVLHRLIVEGATVIRLDALPHAWKRYGGGPHEPEVGWLLQAWRSLSELIGGGRVRLLAESDHDCTALRYVGPERAHCANHLAVPSLVLAASLLGDVQPLATWIERQHEDDQALRSHCFLMTHDGIHLRPMDPPLSPRSTEQLGALLRERGVPCTQTTVRGKAMDYEINGSLADVYSVRGALDVARYSAAHTVLLALPGRPQFYFPTLAALPAGVFDPRARRHANRRRFDASELAKLCRTPERRAVRQPLLRLLRHRQHPSVVQGSPRAQVFGAGVLRIYDSLRKRDGSGSSEVIANFSAAPVSIQPRSKHWRDVAGDRSGSGMVELSPGSALWLEPITP